MWLEISDFLINTSKILLIEKKQNADSTLTLNIIFENNVVQKLNFTNSNDVDLFLSNLGDKITFTPSK